MGVASPSQRATTTVTWAWLATCSDTLPWSVLARPADTARADDDRVVAALVGDALDGAGDVAPGLEHLGLDPGLAQCAVAPRGAPRRGPCGRPRGRSRCGPERTGTTLITPTSASNRGRQLDRLLERPLGGFATVVGEQDLLHARLLSGDAAGGRWRPQAWATGTRLHPAGSIHPAHDGAQRPADRAEGPNGTKRHGTIAG